MPAFRVPLRVCVVFLVAWGCSDSGTLPTIRLEPPPNVPPELVGEWGEPGEGAGQFQNISGMVIDDSDVVYLADYQTPRVQRFSTNGTFVSEWQIEIPGASLTVGPLDLALGPNRLVYALFNNGDGGWIAWFTSTGGFVAAIPLVAGTEDGQFMFPMALAVDDDGNLYVADHVLDEIHKLDSEGRFLAAWTGGDNPLNQPIDLAWGPEGTLFALARQTHVHEFDLDGTTLRSWMVNHHTPEVMAVDPFGLVYTSSQRRQTIARSTEAGVQVEWDDVANGIVVASDGSVLVGRTGSVAVYRYPPE
jgi:sugar lactone lactonase YvrE